MDGLMIIYKLNINFLLLLNILQGRKLIFKLIIIVGIRGTKSEAYPDGETVGSNKNGF